MEEVIGLRGTAGHGSLKEWGVTYRELPLAAGGLVDWTALCTAIRPGTYDLEQCRSIPGRASLLQAGKSIPVRDSLSQAEEVCLRQY